MQISHRIIQQALKKALVPQTVWIEKHFPKINRIADVAWPDQKIIFEVQCSPITVKEIRQREQDYRQEGFTIVWILHDNCFNRPFVTSAERYLSTRPHYFTNLNPFGHGEIYDQYSFIRRGVRVRRTPRYPISIHQYILLKQVPRHFPKERKKWKFGFGGDLFQQNFQSHTFPLSRLYRHFLNHLLEKNCY